MLGMRLFRRIVPFHVPYLYRPGYGLLKRSAFAAKEDAGRFLQHLITLDVLHIKSRQLEKRVGQQFANTQQSVVLGAASQRLLSGNLKVAFARQVQVCAAHPASPSTRTVEH
jgi:hypothetical protein